VTAGHEEAVVADRLQRGVPMRVMIRIDVTT
jgi:hypothetical protein